MNFFPPNRGVDFYFIHSPLPLPLSNSILRIHSTFTSFTISKSNPHMLPPIPILSIALLAWSSCDENMNCRSLPSSPEPPIISSYPSPTSRRTFFRYVQHRTTLTTTAIITTSAATATVSLTPQPAFSQETIIDEDVRSVGSSISSGSGSAE